MVVPALLGVLLESKGRVANTGAAAPSTLHNYRDVLTLAVEENLSCHVQHDCRRLELRIESRVHMASGAHGFQV